MASGHVNRAQRPNTWLHRPSLRREESSYQPVVLHTSPFAWFYFDALVSAERTGHEDSGPSDQIDANDSIARLAA